MLAAGTVGRPQPHAACFDQVQGPGRIAFAEDRLPDGEHHRVELGEDDADNGFRGKLGERGEVAEEHLQLVVFDLQLEVGADFRVDVEQLLERRSIEPQREDVAAGPDRRGVGRPFSISTSPKLSPACSMLSGISSSPSPRFTMRARPDTRTCMASLAAPSSMMTLPNG